MCTSTASKPARSKAAAISICPLTPCSRRIATRGRAPLRARTAPPRRRRCRTWHDATGPGSSRRRGAACSSSAQVGSSRSACIACVVSDQTRAQLCAVLEARCGRRAHGCDRRAAAWPSAWTARPGRAAPSTSRTRATSLGAHLQHRAELLGEQRRERIVAQARRARCPGRRRPANAISTQRHEQAAVGAVVIRQHDARRVELLHGREEALQQRGIVEVGRRRADLPVDLRQRRAAQAVLAAAEVDEQQLACRAASARSSRRQRAAHVAAPARTPSRSATPAR